MSDLKIYDDYNTLPEQVQINKEDIKTLNAKIDTITSNIANLGWELKTNTRGEKSYIPKNFDENIPYSLTNTNDPTQSSGLNNYKDSDGYVWCNLTTYIPADDDFVGIWTGHNNTDGYFCSLSMTAPNDKTTYPVVTYIANSDCPQSLNKDRYKEDMTIATMGWVNKYYLSKTDASNTYLTKTNASNLYVTRQDYIERFDRSDITLTTNGFNKIKTMVEEEGTTITLQYSSHDFTEDIRSTGTNELILNIYYDGTPLYRNIHLMPNQSVNTYDLHDAPEYTSYSGHAILHLPSQNSGYFAIAYNESEQLMLHLISRY